MFPQKAKELFAARLKQIWLQPDFKSAMAMSNLITDEYSSLYPDAIKCLEDGLEDSLQFYHFGNIDHRRISSTNVLERLNKEIRRRSKVVGVFPSQESYIRLLTCYLMEYTEEWEVERSYIKPEKLVTVMETRERLLQKVA
ncbi:MAG: transposase [Sulfurovum sp.]|nr:transposase [Sulfurovum sp.]